MNLKILLTLLARPAPPRNCSLQAGSNSSEGVSWLVVRCVSGYDGGLPQTFVLEALDPITSKIKFNSSVNETGTYCDSSNPLYFLHLTLFEAHNRIKFTIENPETEKNKGTTYIVIDICVDSIFFCLYFMILSSKIKFFFQIAIILY